MNRPKTSIILPTYNEAGHITALLEEIVRYAPPETEIIVIDDNSPDNTGALARHYIDSHHKTRRMRVITRLNNRGLTNSLTEGITRAHGDIILWMDCDFSHPPFIIPKLIRAIDQGADMAIGSRNHKTLSSGSKNTQPQAQTVFSRMLNMVLSVVFGSGITDYTTGFVAAKKTVLQKIPLRGNYGEYCVDLLIRAFGAGYRIVEIPFFSPQRKSGSSKTAPDVFTFLRHGSGYLSTFIRLLWTQKLFRKKIQI